ncbi:MAG: glycosyltransferase family 4 protein [Bacteroidaceae bacterium]|nr:glycosyltransferase family 4 protein [Bacteroidaceae bacterium]
MYNIIQYTDFKSFDVSIVTLIPEKENSRLDDFRKFPINIIPLKESKNFIALYKNLRNIIERISPQILHAHCFRSLVLMNLLPRRYKKLYTVHIYPGLQQKTMLGSIKGSLVIFFSHFFTKKCDVAIGCAESVAQLYKENKGWDIVSIPNGASLPIWDKDEAEKNMLKEKLKLKKHVRYFIFIGRFSKEKNPDVLVKAFLSLKRDDIGLIMLGNGPMWDSLKYGNNVAADSNIIMPGFILNVYDYLKASDFYISTSDVEGLANTLLESMSVGLPLLLSDIPSHREVLGYVNDRKVGCIIQQHCEKDIRERMLEILDIDVQIAGNMIQKLYEEKYTAERMSNSYQDLYRITSSHA